MRFRIIFTKKGNIFIMKRITIDGNTAAAHISYAFSELAIIYPITPSSPMAELADQWAAEEETNLFGVVPKVVQMQSESGVAGAVHGALTCGALTTTYTCSQGLLLMQPNMYKIAGELLPTVFHVSSRALATHALNIFGDHQDVMACRQTGFAMLFASSVQEVMDFALVAHLATLKTSVPFLHVFDGFLTSHEQTTIEAIDYDEIKTLLDTEDIEKFKQRALSPEKPLQRGTAQNGDIYFQNREAANPYYLAAPNLVQEIMDKVAKITKRAYHVFDYFGKPDAENVVVIMGSTASVMEETLEKYNADGGNAGLIKVRLYRPFNADAFCQTLPKSCKRVTVLDRTKEAGALGEPLYLDVCAAIAQQGLSIQTVGGRYGLGGKEVTPAMCYAVLKNLEAPTPKNHFTVGIVDDCAHTSLDIPEYYPLPNKMAECIFYGLGSDGTIGANKNTVKILGKHTDLYSQAYFCYDSKKSGGATISHLRFDKRPIQSSYLIEQADFISCHNPSYLTRYDMLSHLKQKGVFLLNCPWESQEELKQNLPIAVKRQIAKKEATFYTIDATKIANEVGLGGRTGTIMQAAFFLVNAYLLPFNEAISYLKEEVNAVFSRKGEALVQKNFDSLDRVKNAVKKVEYPSAWADAHTGLPLSPLPENEYFQKFMHPILALEGDKLPVSAFSADGSVPTGTAKLERHGVAYELPKWIPENCIQCNQCAFNCPHATIRPVLLNEQEKTPTSFVTRPAFGVKNALYRIQVVAQHCMGCGVCTEVCPAKEKALVMRPATELMPTEGENWEFAKTIRQIKPENFPMHTVKGSQFQTPLFEFSYACAGCGETAYIKVLTQLFGERMVIANATGCSSIYGGSAPSCPYTVSENGRGPAWANSLFEDNAEFGYGMRLAFDANEKNRSVWIIGGDGWAYDIGFGGLDHVLASGKNVNVLVLDSEVYSNTGGQSSKATPMGAIARFAAAGKRTAKKNLGLMMMSYGNVYVAQVSMGANEHQLLKAFTEAEAYDGPSLIIAYTPCIAHGINMRNSAEEERLAVESGYWPLYRFNPTLRKEGKNPFILDSKAPTVDFYEFLKRESRFSALKNADLSQEDNIFRQAEEVCKKRFALYQTLAELSL